MECRPRCRCQIPISRASRTRSVVIDSRTHTAHGTFIRWTEGCDCEKCRQAQNDAARARGRTRAQRRLPVEMRQQLLDAIYDGQPFRTVSVILA